MGHSNQQKFQDYFSQHQCEHIYNFKGKYKALCHKGVVRINDYFIADFESNEMIAYGNIKNIERDENKVYIQQRYLATVLAFEKQEESLMFYKALTKKVRP